MILIICDHKKRELAIQQKLAKHLEEKNLECKIVNKHLVLKYYNYFKPKIIIFPHANGYLSKVINLLDKKVIKILMPTEHCAFVDKFIDMHYLNNFQKWVSLRVIISIVRSLRRITANLQDVGRRSYFKCRKASQVKTGCLLLIVNRRIYL